MKTEFVIEIDYINSKKQYGKIKSSKLERNNY
jgi:hypothetical protein